MDFYQVKERSLKKDSYEIYPDFLVCRSRDLMVRGKAFYAIWDEDAGIWSTDEYDVQRMVDDDLFAYFEKVKNERSGNISVKSMRAYSSNSWKEFKKYLTQVPDSNHTLDTKLAFANSKIRKTDYISKRLPYALEEGTIDAYDEIIGTLYSKEERAKIEWAIGSIVTGDSKDIQKFLVLYGEAGAGKSTILNIIQQLFEGYYTMFEAKADITSPLKQRHWRRITTLFQPRCSNPIRWLPFSTTAIFPESKIIQSLIPSYPTKKWSSTKNSNLAIRRG